MNKKDEYEKPSLTEYGSVQELTAEVSPDSYALDEAYGDGTPQDELTFSPE